MFNFFNKKFEIILSMFLDLNLSFVLEDLYSSILLLFYWGFYCGKSKAMAFTLFLLFYIQGTFLYKIFISHQNSIFNKFDIVLIRMKVFSIKLSRLLRIS